MGMEEDPKKEAEEKFSFLQETIKKEPVSGAGIRKKILRIAALGLVFGMFACIGFYVLEPWAARTFQEKADKVTIPEDEENPEGKEAAEEEETKAAVLSAENYDELVGSVYEIGREAERCVVSVDAAAAAMTPDQSTDAARQGVSGVIVADNGPELLILASNTVCKDAESFQVHFSDNSTCAAALKKQDRTVGLAVFAVKRNEIPDGTWSSLRVATLGNSNMVVRGRMVIALGNMFGYPGGISYGIVSSVKYHMDLADGSYGILATDMAAAQNGTGVLFNMDGEVTGLIMPGIWQETGDQMTNAYAISDLKPAIERLSNGESVPYTGIYGVTVDDETSESQGLPKGLYVRQVDADSPAMNAGIQNGDILTQIGKTKITSVLVYQKALQETDAGQNVTIRGQRRGGDGYVDVEYKVTVGSLE